MTLRVATVARAQARAQVRLADLLHIGELVAGQCQDRLRVAGAERPGLPDRGDGFEICRARRQRPVDQEGIRSSRRCHGGAEAIFEVGPKGAERGALERHARRHGMPAAFDEKPVAHGLAHGAAEIDAGDRAARPGADAAGSERDREGPAGRTAP